MRKPSIHPGQLSVANRVLAVVQKQLDVDAAAVTLEASLTDDLEADSLDVVELIMALEEEFEIKFPDQDVENIRVVGDVVQYIEGRLQGAA